LFWNCGFFDLTTFSSSRIPAWKRLVDCSHTTDKRISLIADVFSDPDETEVIMDLRGDDAQSFIDVVDEVPPVLSSEQNGLTDSNSDFLSR